MKDVIHVNSPRQVRDTVDDMTRSSGSTGRITSPGPVIEIRGNLIVDFGTGPFCTASSNLNGSPFWRHVRRIVTTELGCCTWHHRCDCCSNVSETARYGPNRSDAVAQLSSLHIQASNGKGTPCVPIQRNSGSGFECDAKHEGNVVSMTQAMYMHARNCRVTCTRLSACSCIKSIKTCVKMS
jgi:hypothetical protein